MNRSAMKEQLAVLRYRASMDPNDPVTLQELVELLEAILEEQQQLPQIDVG